MLKVPARTSMLPVNYVDPSGMAFWVRSADDFDMSSVPNNAVSIRVQLLATNENWSSIHAEYPVNIGEIRQLLNSGANLSSNLMNALSVLYKAKYWTYVDLLNESTGEIWEIKPKSLEATGVAEVQARLAIMQAVQALGKLRGNDHPIRGAYDWTASPQWILGSSLWQTPVYLGTDPTGWWTFYARQSQPGVVIWWKVKNGQSQPSEHPIPVPLPMRWTDRNTEENHPERVYIPGRGVIPNPALAMIRTPICAAACHVPGYEQAPVSRAWTEASINTFETLYGVAGICFGIYLLGPTAGTILVPAGAR